MPDAPPQPFAEALHHTIRRYPHAAAGTIIDALLCTACPLTVGALKDVPAAEQFLKDRIAEWFKYNGHDAIAASSAPAGRA